jgi:hypothetical protein
LNGLATLPDRIPGPCLPAEQHSLALAVRSNAHGRATRHNRCVTIRSHWMVGGAVHVLLVMGLATAAAVAGDGTGFYVARWATEANTSEAISSNAASRKSIAR